MKITFLGAAGTVTGSKYLLEAVGKKILVDCGLFQGLKELRLRNWAEFPVDIAQIDAVLLTHAHIDHSGFLPLLWRKGYRGPIYATPATKDLCAILLPDTGKLQEEEAEYANRKRFSKHHPALPLFTAEDGQDVMKIFKPVSYKTKIQLGGDVEFEFIRSGHILGSAFIRVRAEGKTVVFSGDLGRPEDLIMQTPETIDGADYLLIESTYGNRLHSNTNLLDELSLAINRAIARSGVVLIPAFAVGRSQALLYAIHLLKREGRISSDIPVYLNSPMAISAMNLYCRYHEEHRLDQNECGAMCDVARYVSSVEESKKLNERKGPMIIVAASGMATGGRILHHLTAFAPDSKNMILLSGFQAAGTRGAQLQAGAKTVKIHGREVPINCETVSLSGFSAHADQSEILSWLKMFKKPPKSTFVVHGEPEASRVLRDKIETDLGWSATVASDMKTVELT